MSEKYDIPKEYSSADYGFSAIDEATYKAQQEENEVTPPSIDENDISRVMLNVLKPIEDKIELLMVKKRTEDDDAVATALSAANESTSEALSLIHI